MTHPIYGVISADVVGPFTLQVSFDDGLTRRIDLHRFLPASCSVPCAKSNFSNQVRVDTEVHTVVWPNGADFDPATLHDWPIHEAAFRDLAQRWELAIH
jgi:hypothetical protein